MKDQEILGLMEAYSSMYVPQELTEEVEIAAQYFYEMGLNEDGVDILIEELGLEEFANFVYDIAEDYILTEARAGGVKIEPKLASGKEIKGKPKASSLKRLGAQKEARKEAEEKASESKPSGMKASLQRQSAVAAAAKKQPKKPGFLDRVAGAVNAGIKRHNDANKNLNKVASETGKTLSKVGKAAATVAKGVASGVSGTAKLAGHVAKKGLSEEVEAWVNQLVEEGYDLSEYTWDEMTEIYIAEAKIDDVKYGEGEKDSSRNSYLSKNSPNVRTDRNKRFDSTAGKLTTHSEVEGKRLSKHFSGRGVKKEQVDLYDIILSHLLDEGYAESVEQAEVIMVNMSEDWRESIVEEVLDEKKYEADEKLPGSGKTPNEKMQRAQGKHGANYMSARGDVRFRGNPANSSHSRGRKVKIIKDIIASGEDPRNSSQAGIGWGNDARKIGRPGDRPGDRIKKTNRTEDDDAKSTHTQGGLRAHKTKAGGYRTLKKNEG